MYHAPIITKVDVPEVYRVITAGGEGSSLGETCSKFMTKYGNESRIFSVDEVAHKIQVQKRSLYDLFQILESIKMMSKLRKDTYQYHGMKQLPRLSHELQKKAVQIWSQDSQMNSISSINPEGMPNCALKHQTPNDCGMSLSSMTKRFIQLFLVENKLITMQMAMAEISTISSHTPSSSHQKSEITTTVLEKNSANEYCHLYDIADVLVSLNIIEKIVNSKRNVFYQWKFHMSASDIIKISFNTEPIYTGGKFEVISQIKESETDESSFTPPDMAPNGIALATKKGYGQCMKPSKEISTEQEESRDTPYYNQYESSESKKRSAFEMENTKCKRGSDHLPVQNCIRDLVHDIYAVGKIGNCNEDNVLSRTQILPKECTNAYLDEVKEKEISKKDKDTLTEPNEDETKEFIIVEDQEAAPDMKRNGHKFRFVFSP